MKKKSQARKPNNEKENRISNIIDAFKDKRICVIGDIIADVYIFGKPYRLSREAPVVVVKYEGAQVYPGSAGNTMNNLLALGAFVYPVGFVGNDNTGAKLVDFFSGRGNVDIGGIIRYEGSTITKTRILAGDRHTSKQQVIRIDRDDNRRYTMKEKKQFMERLKEIITRVDAFVISDYGHGAVDDKVIDFVRKAAAGRPLIGDSRYNLRKCTDFTLITPNEAEAYELSGLPEDTVIEDVGTEIMASMGLEALLITRGNRGMSLFLGNGKVHHIPVSGKDDVTDVTGAGDTVCAAVALALAGGADFYTASRIANYAAGVVVMKRGTATTSPDELKEALEAAWAK